MNTEMCFLSLYSVIFEGVFKDMNIYQHFRPEEKEFIDQVLNFRDLVEKTYTPKLTDFLDPREQHIMKVLIGEHSDIKCEFFGGEKNTERKRAILMPDYENVTKEDDHPSYPRRLCGDR